MARKNYYGMANEISKTDKRQSKWKEQRAKVGFDDTETWALDFTITSFVLPRLKRFKELTNGVPFSVEGETLEDREANWGKILDQMIRAFELLKESDGRWLSKKELSQVTKGFENIFKVVYAVYGGNMDVYAVAGDLSNLILADGKWVINGNWKFSKYRGKAWFIRPGSGKRIELQWVMKAPCVKYTSEWGGKHIDYNYILMRAEQKLKVEKENGKSYDDN